MLEKIQQYLDTEYNKVVDYFEYQYEWAIEHTQAIYTMARSRGAGVIKFAEDFLDVEQEKLAPMYTEYITKVYEKIQKEKLDK